MDMSYWAKLTDETWGPDPLLTDTGIEQAYNVNNIRKQELSYGIPIPESFYSSPFSRTITTALISFEGIVFGDGDNVVKSVPKAIIKEQKFRERNYRQHTCNMRRTRSFIKETYPQFEIEPGFTEEDIFWNTTGACNETDDLLRIQVREVLDEIFENDKSCCGCYFISPLQRFATLVVDIFITAHAHTNRLIREVLGAPEKRMPTGGVFAMVISVTPSSAI
ncbi:hypothetical protein Clacol_004639 [Clathrus columnatus]|uniref:Uncharacterized protein n=1 Tax=Clathrus columnatus TaxID=1419009 RepID=A0AAV5AAB0_9AGAM|nr:hypothetical protein Clacol_004639 [Clathrus columnatus]